MKQITHRGHHGHEGKKLFTSAYLCDLRALCVRVCLGGNPRFHDVRITKWDFAPAHQVF
jgi:hypothetical protein